MLRVVQSILVAAALVGATTARTASVPWLDSHQSDWRAFSTASAQLPAAWDGKRIFVLGAFHGVAENGPIDLAVLPALQRQAGVRTYAAEISHAHALYLNRFLTTGDEAPLERVMAGMRGFGDWTVEQRDFWIELRRWNQTLPVAGRLKIIGIDFERFSPEISLAWLREAVGRAGTPSAADQAALVRRLTALAPDAPLESVKALAAAWSASWRSQPAPWEAYFGEDAYDVRFVVDNLQQRFDCQADPASFDPKREQVFYHNLEREAAHAPLAGIFCRLGTAHALQRPFDGVARFAALLQASNSPWRGRVASIFPLYVDGQNLAVKQGRYRVAANADQPTLTQPFARSARFAWTLFEVQGEGSPFAANSQQPGETWRWINDRPVRTDAPRGGGVQLFGGFSGGVTADYLSEFLLVRGSHVAHPLVERDLRAR